MKLMLDTHAFIWWDENPSKLGAASRRACSDPDNELILSTASVWEIQLKRMIGKLTLAKSLRQLPEEQARQNELEISPIQVEHILQLETRRFTIVIRSTASRLPKPKLKAGRWTATTGPSVPTACRSFGNLHV